MQENLNPDGLAPHELGFAELASGNFAVVEANGDVSNIFDRADWYGDIWVARAEQERA